MFECLSSSQTLAGAVLTLVPQTQTQQVLCHPDANDITLADAELREARFQETVILSKDTQATLFHVYKNL